MAENRSELALIKNGEFFLWSSPMSVAELSSDPPQVGHPRRPLDTGGATCGLVDHLGPDGYATFRPITDDVQARIVEALFELKLLHAQH